MDRQMQRIAIALLLAWLPVGAFVVKPPALTGDEAYYAQVPIEMRWRGDWLVPYFNGEPRYKKPPLMYWLVAAAQRVFGENEPASRLPSLFAALLTAALLWWFGRQVNDPTTGLWAGAAFLLNPMTMVLANWGAPEATLCFFVTASILLGFLGLEQNQMLLVALSGAAAGLGLLTKGAPGLVLPLLALAPLVLKALWQPNRTSVRFAVAVKVALWLAVFVCVATPWFVAMGLREGKAFWQVFFLQEHFQRVATPMEGHRGPVWYYLPILWLLFFPWSVRLPHAVIRIVKIVRQPTSPADAVDIAMAWWGLSVVGLFSLVATKLPHYIFPALPALAWLSVRQWHRSLSKDEFWTVTVLAVFPLPLLLYGAHIALPAYADFLTKSGFQVGDELPLLRSALGFLVAGWFGAGLIAAGFLWWERKRERLVANWGALGSAVTLTFTFAVAAFLLLHAAGGQQAVGFGRQFTPLATFGSDTEWVVFYARRPVPFFRGDSERAKKFLRTNKDAALLFRVDFARRLRSEGLKVQRYGIWCVATRQLH